jgi:hypothetical protein
MIGTISASILILAIWIKDIFLSGFQLLTVISWPEFQTTLSSSLPGFQMQNF